MEKKLNEKNLEQITAGSGVMPENNGDSGKWDSPKIPDDADRSVCVGFDVLQSSKYDAYILPIE